MYNKVLTEFPKISSSLISFTQKPNISKTSSKLTLPTLFSANPTSLRFKKEISNMLSSLSIEQKMLYQNGGQWQAYPRYTYDGSSYCINRFVHSPKGYTNGLEDCIAVLLHNDSDAYLYHLAPGVHKSDIAVTDMQKGIQETIAKLETNKKCSAVLVGGNSTKASHMLYENISEILKRNNIETQEVLFAEGHKSIYYDLNKGIMICEGIFDNIEDLKTEFERVHILDTKTL